MKKTGSDLRLIANHPVFQFEASFFSASYISKKGNYADEEIDNIWCSQLSVLFNVRPFCFETTFMKRGAIRNTFLKKAGILAKKGRERILSKEKSNKGLGGSNIVLRSAFRFFDVSQHFK